MNYKIYSNSLFFLLFFNLILFSNSVVSQTFERIELPSGLGVLSENNGVAVADYDGDMDLDIFVVAKGKDNVGVEKSISRLFRNNNDGSFTDVTIESKLTNLFTVQEYDTPFLGLDGTKFGVSWGDYDNDGFPDIFFTHSFKVQLFKNLKNGTFKEVTIAAGIEQTNECRNTGATWVDYNNDGFLDLFINDWDSCGGNKLYLNNGDGTFQNESLNTNIGTGTSFPSYTMFPYDFNNDGWIDFYISNDFKKPNSLFINQKTNSFEEQAANYGLNSSLDDMGIAMCDFNNDGKFDLFTTGITNNGLFKNNGDNTFSEVSYANGVSKSEWAWGCKFSDFDLDGDEDLFVVNGFKTTTKQPNRYFKNLYKEDQNTFKEISSELGLNELTRSLGIEEFDFDNDGDLDIYVTNTDQTSFFYENKTLNSNKSSNLNWLKVSLKGTVSNRDAIGTKISVTTNEGTFIRYYNGVGMLSQSLKPVHFGLNQAIKIIELKITWPSGLIESYQNLNSNKTIRATEGQGIQVLSIQPSKKIYGCTDPNSCNYNPLATASDNSCIIESTNEIIGNTESGFNNTDTYTYELSNNSEVIWSVEGGKIESGQGTSAIKVKWGIEAQGKITVQEKINNCTLSQKELTVNLNINTVLENVSVARIWNEALLDAIRKDFARPTVHSRNLFQTSIALYDSWAIYDEKASPYLIGNNVNGFQSTLENFVSTESKEISVNKTMSYAVYRLLSHRFKNSPGKIKSLERFDLIMSQLGYDINNTSTNYQTGDAAALGNYIGQTIINYGLIDGSNESNNYVYTFYQPINPPLDLDLSGHATGIVDPNRWQPLSFDTFIDQSGNIIPGSTPKFLGPEWGKVFPFALKNKSILERDGNQYVVYHQPEEPPHLNITTQTQSSNYYKWNFSLVSKWSSHLDATDGVMWDISPKSIGNIDSSLFPKNMSEYPDFYNENDGGDIGKGYSMNPKTGQPYETQMVPRGDYTRVLAEFWADGPDSETPPGHWFTILNYVTDHPLFTRKLNGQGEELSPLEWDVKAYFILAGAVHDAAVTAWGIKGWVDYIRPISAIRYMSELGQSTDPNLPNYHVGGIPLTDGLIEPVKIGDPLSGENNKNVGKIKVKAWIGHDAIQVATIDVAGAGWILAENWWPYQRPSFVTPPFAGFISGHSTFSRAAAEVMTLLTGDAFFPGGMSEFKAPKNQFLVFEKGPSQDITLQWATYRDASDQCSLSRIWGGIHPPADDIPGRKIGMEIGVEAYNFALPYFNSNGLNTTVISNAEKTISIYPNPVTANDIYITNTTKSDDVTVYDVQGRSIQIIEKHFDFNNNTTLIKLSNTTASGIYFLKVNSISKVLIKK